MVSPAAAQHLFDKERGKKYNYACEISDYLRKEGNAMVGDRIYEFAGRIFPINRSITGKGVRETLAILNDYLKKNGCRTMTIHEVPSGTPVFDWTVPKEWEITEGYIENSKGEHIVDLKDHPLHIMGYSTPVDAYMDLEELKQYLYYQEDLPDAIPYVTSYYRERFGFCLTKNVYDSLTEDLYHVRIDSRLFDGSLTYAELILEGESEKEIFFSSYICHPQMANNETSGPALMAQLILWLSRREHRKYTYRFVLIPETIGSITYLSRNLSVLKERMIAGFNLSCVGDDLDYSIMETRYGNTLADRVLTSVLESRGKYTRYSYLKRGSDERQYNAPGVDLPVVGFSRTLYGCYEEYHTSKDDMSFISPAGFQGAFEVIHDVVEILEHNGYYRVKVLCEPQLGKRGLYPTVSRKGIYDEVKNLTNFIAYCDGTNDLMDISRIIGVPPQKLIEYQNSLMENDLLERVDGQEKV